MKLKTLIASAALFVLPFATQAADLPVKAPAYVPVYGWSGYYFGVFAGVDFAKWSRSGLYDSNPLVNADPSLTAAVFGVQYGYDWTMSNNIIVGIVSDYSVLTGAAKMWPASTDSTSYADLRTRWLSTTRLRVGTTMMDPQTLLYLTGGAAYGRTTYTVIDGTCTYICNHQALWQFGGTVGAGAEHKVTKNVSAFAEYQHVMLASKTFGQPFTFATGNNFNVGITSTFDIFKVGLNVRLN